MFHRALVLVWSLCCWGALASNSPGPFSLRLVGGEGRCQGELQVQWAGQDWISVNPLPAPRWLGQRFCAALDCGPTLKMETKTVSERKSVYLSNVDCDVSSLITCFDPEIYQSEDSLQLTCSDSVRLVSGRTSCSGSLQIRGKSADESWTSVCDGALDRQGAEVLCRELSCGPPLLQGELSARGQMFQCQGNESALMDCPRDQTRIDPGTCSGPSLNLTCAEPVRLVGGAGRCEGTLEMAFSGVWRRVTSALLDRWRLETVGAVCRDLDCGSALSSELRAVSNFGEMWTVDTDCVRTSSVSECVRSEEFDLESRQVSCLDSVRLVSGRTSCSGSLQIWDRSWTSPCDGALDRHGAEVLCRELRCGPPLLQGELSPLGQMFQCQGNESALMDCPRNQTRTVPGTCSGPTQHLTCAEPLRLVGGASRCEGIVEVELGGEWRRVWTQFAVDLTTGAAVCRELGCGSVVSADDAADSHRAMWRVNDYCVKNSSVRDCAAYGDFAINSSGLRVVCSGKA